jgi:putative ABC transport system permease protein
VDWKDRLRSEVGSRVDDDVIEELAQHARAMYEAARADGCSDVEAGRRVAVQIALWRDDAGTLRHRPRREVAIEPPAGTTAPWFAGLSHDLRYAFRLLGRQPRYAVLVVIMMALGIGATTALFSVAYGVLMKPLPWPHADRLVLVKETRGGNAPRFGGFSNAAYLAWQEDAKTIEGLAGWSRRLVTLSGAGEPERIAITVATPSLFPLLGVRPLIGSFFQTQDENAPVAVLSESLWRQRFGADPAVLGEAVHLDAEPYTVVGVLPDAQAYPDSQTRAYIPFRVPQPSGNLLSLFEAIALVRAGTTPAQVAAEGTARGRFVADTGLTTTAIFGGSGQVAVAAQPLVDALTGAVRRPLLVLLVAVGLLLATAVGNIVSLQLARTTARLREMAIRAAIGAGIVRVTRQLLVESLLIGGAGGAAGLALAWLAHRTLPSLLPGDFPRASTLGIDGAVLSFAIAVTVAASVVFGLSPALRVRRLNLAGALAEDGNAPVGNRIRSRTAAARLLIIAGQVGIACVLLVGASLLGRSFVRIVEVDRGYEPSGLITARLSLPSTMYKPERRFAVMSTILEQLRQTGGVADVAFTSALPLTPGGATAAFRLKTSGGESVPVQASNRLVSSRIVSTLGMRVIAGRGFSDSDTETAAPVAVVNKAFARRYLGEPAIGAQVPMGAGYQDPDAQATVIGVVDDIRYMTGDEGALPEIYYTYRQLRGVLPLQVVMLLVRTSGDPAAFAPTLRDVIRRADASLAIDGILTMEARIAERLALRRLYAVLLGGFAILAVVIAVVGLFGVLSYNVAQRSRELAVRSALGARQADIVRLVLREGLTVTVAGIAAGLLASVGLTRWIASLLYGVTTRDAVTFAAMPVILLVVSAAACVIPARRAATLDPIRALRGN